jgi:hypothetical protein
MKYPQLVLWIRMDPHHFGNLDLHPDPHSHQIKSGSGSALYKNQYPDPHQSDMLNPEPDLDPHQFTDVWDMSLIEHFFKGLSLYLEARI